MRLEGRILCHSYNELLVLGCENGWIYVFDGRDLVWAKKLRSTYYRGPYHDVNIISVAVDDLVVVGTDFTDGKVYAFDLEGEKLWERLFMSIVGCWERPNDIVAVDIGENIAVCDEWINSSLNVLDRKGNTIRRVELDGFVKALKQERVTVVGTTKKTYIDDRIIKIPCRDIRVKEFVFCSNEECVFAVDGKGVVWIRKFDDPVFDVGEIVAVCDERGLHILSRDGELVDFRKIEKPMKVFVTDDEVILGYRNKIVWNDGRERRIRGIPIHIGDAIISYEDYELFFY